jgi:alkanesulfonate monooxygenase SsuD/methylene tetrahydromethanopterin reductase-like flavin-dependent oxidoreductase (luciferase family)
MRFAIKTRPEHQTWAQMREVWLAADQIELFESAWNWDHFYPLTGDLTGPNLEGWTMLAAMAEATSRIRVGCQVSAMVYRAGRLELGVGAGWNQLECDAYGIDLPPLPERFDRFDEGVQAIISLLTEEVATFDGRYVTLTEARCEPKPLQRPHPPIVIGGRGKKRTLRSAARWAQQWNAITADPTDWLDLKQTLLAHCEQVGRDPAEITCSANVRLDGTGADQLNAAVESAAAYGEAGADLIVFGLPNGASPDVLQPLAQRLAVLA